MPHRFYQCLGAVAVLIGAVDGVTALDDHGAAAVVEGEGASVFINRKTFESHDIDLACYAFRKDTPTSPRGLSFVFVPFLSAVPVLPPMR